MAYDQCKKNIPPGTGLCAENHCSSFRESSTMAKFCKCIGWDGQPIPDCKPQGGDFPVETGECCNQQSGERRVTSVSQCQDLRDKDRNWRWQACFCCCSCFAWGTRVAVAAEAWRVVQSIQLGDTVRCTRVGLNAGHLQLDWQPRTVTFSDGMAPAPNQTAVMLQYGDQGELVVTPDQPLLMPDGSLKTADRLTTDDYLVDRAGLPVPIHAVILGRHEVGFHSITTQDFSETVRPEWFLETNGVVVGDHLVLAMQDAEALAALFAPGHDDLPKIGSSDYAEEARDAHSLTAALGAQARAIATRGFTPLDDAIQLNTGVPYGASPYVTEAQAADIARHGRFRGLSETFLVHDFNHFSALFSSFYPDVHFYLAWEDLNPNMYAFKAYGNQTVYLSGQMLRYQGMFKQGLAMIMAQGAARFLPGTIHNDAGLCCTGLADYSGANQVLQTLFYGDYNSWALAGYRQILQLFSEISPANLPGREVCATPSIPCRLQTIDAAISGMPLPPCAGGPIEGALRLEDARWSRYQDASAIRVDFNLRLRASSALALRNYLLTREDSLDEGEIRIGLVQFDAHDPSGLYLIIDGAAPAAALMLQVRDIVADNGSSLDPQARTCRVQGT
jgi:hypothetical protein